MAAEQKIYGVYILSSITQKVYLSITEIGNNLKQNLEQKIISKNEGKCIAEGFIRPNSVKIMSYSSGNIEANSVSFECVFDCMVCHPVEGMLIECVAKTITKAGIHAEVITDNKVVPVTVFVARDHHDINKYFNSIKENTLIAIRVIGVRFELNDPYICVIGQLIDNSSQPPAGQRERKKAGLSRLTIHPDFEEGDEEDE
jgi:DNA-directed RNA polymerase subunit E'/Rpb7